MSKEYSKISTLKDLAVILKENFKDDLLCLKSIIEAYNESDWKNHVCFSLETYHKNLIYETTDFEIYIISWKKGQKTKIHDHPSAGCLLKVLDGELVENLYSFSEYSVPTFVHISANNLKKNSISYRKDKIILHDICAIEDSVSIHIYSPKNHKTAYY